MHAARNAVPRAHGAIVTGLAVLFLFAASFGVAEAHDHGVLKLASRTLRAGDSVAIGGEKFSHSDGVTLALVGATGRVVLGDVPTDAAGAFHRTMLVPAMAAAGQYRLIAEAVDGDEVASLDVIVVSAASIGSGPPTVSGSAAPMPPMPGMEQMAGHSGMSMGPTGESLTIARARSSAVTVTAVVVILACVLAGAQLLRRARITTSEESQ